MINWKNNLFKILKLPIRFSKSYGFQSTRLIHLIFILFMTLMPLYAVSFLVNPKVERLTSLEINSSSPNEDVKFNIPQIQDLAFPFIYYRTLWISFLTPLLYCLNAFVLVKFFLRKKKFVYYGLSLLAAFALIISLNYVWNSYLIEQNFFVDVPKPLLDFERSNLHLPFIAVPLVMIIAVSTSVEIIAEWLRQERKSKEISHEKLQAELAFLKSQINPHFLFNTLNNIYSLAAEKSDQTEVAILKLAQLLRYTLYESNTESIGLEKEIAHIENYIELQKMRISSKKNIRISLHCEGNFAEKQIAPMLLIPFVENAFKHGLSYLSNSTIHFYLKIQENCLYFEACNQKFEENHTTYIAEGNGIGLANVMRRLDLLYARNHTLQINETLEKYQVKLQIELYDLRLHSH